MFLAKIDATEEDTLAGRYGVVSYPVLKLFHGTEKDAVDYTGPRDGHGMMYHLERILQPKFQVVQDASTLGRMLQVAQDAVVLMLVPPSHGAGTMVDSSWSDAEALLMARLDGQFPLVQAGIDLLPAGVLREDQGQTLSRSVKEDKQACLLVVRPIRFLGRGEQRAFELCHREPAGMVDGLNDVLREKSFPVVTLLTPGTKPRLEALSRPTVTLFINVDFDVNAATTRYLINRFRATVTDDSEGMWPALSFAVGDLAFWQAHLAEHFGEKKAPLFLVTIEDSKGVLGSLRKFKSNALTSQTPSKFVCSGILPFLRRYMAGEERPFVKSGRSTKDAKAAIDEIVDVTADTFHDYVDSLKYDVAVLVFSPWDARSRAASSLFLAVAKHLYSVPTMAFARISVEENDVDPRYGQSTTLPRIYLANASAEGKAQPAQYQGGNTFGELMDFIRANAAKPMDMSNVGRINSTVNRQRLESLARYEREQAAAASSQHEADGRDDTEMEGYDQASLDSADEAYFTAHEDVDAVAAEVLGRGAASVPTGVEPGGRDEL